MNVVGSLINSVLYSRLIQLSIGCLLCLWSFASTAAITLDPQIEQQLEQYLVLTNTDEDAATAFLSEVEKEISALAGII